jgi:peptide/nickel transport system substrate-binding protein
VLGVACGPASTGTTGPAAGAPSKPKVLNIGVSTELPVIGVFAGTSTGGWTTLTELHSTGLVTPDAQEPRMTGRLAVSVPSVEDGSISITPNGQMRVVYRLRHGVTWQDGAPFTAQDLVFTQTFLFDKNLPVVLRDSAKQVASIEAPDDFTAVFTFAQPYSLGGSLGVRDYWPQPRHLLQEPYDRYQASGSSDEVVNLPYWTSAYVGLGPFRVTTFDPGEGVTMQAYDGFFLGRPKVDTVNVRPFRDENTLFANVLAGAIDVFPEPALHPEFADDLKRWEAESLGTIHTLPGTTSFLAPQWRPEVQKEPANLDVHVRQALYQAIDRDAFPPGLVQQAWALLPPGHPLYDATKDALKRYPYDRVRARALLDEAGWTMAPDGLLRNNTDGRKFQNRISTVATGRQWEVATYADAWRKVGIETEEALVPAAQSRDLQFRALYPSWEASSSAYGDGILGRLTGPAASPENRWAGNRGGYDDPAAQLLIARYYASISDKDQLQVMHELSDLVVSQLPLLISYYGTYYNGVRKGVTALNDAYGKQDTSARNSHLWDVTS